MTPEKRSVLRIIKDLGSLTQKSDSFIPGRDGYIIQDLLNTAEAHKENCAGLAAPQIGYHVRAIVVKINEKFVPFTNPAYSKLGAKTYSVEEGCLSVEGRHLVKRSQVIMLSYDGPNGKRKYQKFNGYIAQIIQHEVDHLNGVLICGGVYDCDACGDAIAYKDAIEINGKFYCKDCVHYCAECNEAHALDTRWVRSEKIYVCSDCLNTNFVWCSDRQEYIRKTDTN